MEDVGRIISECVDEALSVSGLIDKETFYSFLKQQHGLEREMIGCNFEVFHNVIKELLGSKHYRIEQLTIRVLHDRTKQGVYSKKDELIAFDKLVNIFIRDANESILLVRQHDFKEVSVYIQNLEKTVQEESINRFNRIQILRRMLFSYPASSGRKRF